MAEVGETNRDPVDAAQAEQGCPAATTTSTCASAHTLGATGALDGGLRLVERATGEEVPLPWIESILDHVPYYVMLVDSYHHILFANAAVQRSLQKTPAEIVGGYCPKVVHGKDGVYPGCPLERSIQSGEPVETQYLDPDLNIWMRSGIYPTDLDTAEGRPVYLHTARDVTETVSAQEQVRRSHDVQRLVNDLLRLALQPKDLDTILQAAVDRIVAIPWLAGRPRSVVFLTDESNGALALIAAKGIEAGVRKACSSLGEGECLCGLAAATGQPQYGMSDDQRHTIRPPEMTRHGNYCLPIRDGDAILGVLSVGVDHGHPRDDTELQFLTTVTDVLAGIIQRKRAEAERRQHQRVAISRERMARLGELTAGVAHTVRNPLHGILNCVEILERDASRGKQPSQDILSMMRDGLERIEKVTARLLALTRETQMSRRRTNLGDLISDVCDLAGVQARKQRVELAIDVAYADEVFVDPDRVVEGLTGVISNALDACQAGDRVTVRSSVMLKPEGPQLVLAVEDTGCGIPEENLKRVLDPFFTTKPVGEGSGLGLAITRRVMHEHGGDVEIESDDDGTTVRLVFPGGAITTTR